jgi:hypothetical protein
MTRISGASDALSFPSPKLGKTRPKRRVKREREHRPPPDVDSLEGMEDEGIDIGDVEAPDVMITSVNLVHNAPVELPLARSFPARAPPPPRAAPPRASPGSPFLHPPKHSTGNESQWDYAKEVMKAK